MRISLLASALCLAACDAAAHAEQVDDDAITPTEKVTLFNGRDLTGWYSFLVDTKLEDPRKVFTVRDGVIRISGEGLGYLSTERAYRNFRLVVEFRWGERNWKEREGKARDSGIFLHSVGPEGNSVDAGGAYKAALECQIMEGAVGDILLIKGHDERGKVVPLAATTTAASATDADRWPYFQPDGKPKTLTGWGRINWRDKSPRWKDEFGVRGEMDVEEPAGEWNRLECTCAEDRIDITLNGVLVNQAQDVFPAAGKILLQCEGSEIFFRRVELHPLKPEEPRSPKNEDSVKSH